MPIAMENSVSMTALRGGITESCIVSYPAII